MSAMLCNVCGSLVDTDADPDSLYVKGRECLCQYCRSSLDEPSQFEADLVEAGAGGMK